MDERSYGAAVSEGSSAWRAEGQRSGRKILPNARRRCRVVTKVGGARRWLYGRWKFTGRSIVICSRLLPVKKKGDRRRKSGIHFKIKSRFELGVAASGRMNERSGGGGMESETRNKHNSIWLLGFREGRQLVVDLGSGRFLRFDFSGGHYSNERRPTKRADL